MFYRRYTPPPPLSAFVGCLWYSEGFEGSHQLERLLPNGESGIVFDLRERPTPVYNGPDQAKGEMVSPALFCGARTDCFVIETSQQQRVIGIQFRPGGAFPFLSMPASEAANATYALDDIWPGRALPIRDALMNAGCVGEMFAQLERELLARLSHAAPFHPGLAFAIRQLALPSEGIRVRDVADRAGLGSRRFMEIFRDHTGLTPKAFQRVRRFQHVLQSLHAKSDENWTALALRCGYYDQAHFIHDFRAFSGMTPSEYVLAATPHLNHVPLA